MSNLRSLILEYKKISILKSLLPAFFCCYKIRKHFIFLFSQKWFGKLKSNFMGKFIGWSSTKLYFVFRSEIQDGCLRGNKRHQGVKNSVFLCNVERLFVNQFWCSCVFSFLIKFSLCNLHYPWYHWRLNTNNSNFEHKSDFDMSFSQDSNGISYMIWSTSYVLKTILVRRVWRDQKGNQNPWIEGQTTQWPKEKVQKDN
jgi:hypothetical protein